MTILYVHYEGRVSQIFHLFPSFYSQNNYFKKLTKLDIKQKLYFE